MFDWINLLINIRGIVICPEEDIEKLLKENKLTYKMAYERFPNGIIKKDIWYKLSDKAKNDLRKLGLKPERQ